VATEHKGYWPLPDDLSALHDAVIDFAVNIQGKAATKHEEIPQGPLSHAALFRLHRTAIVTHRSVKTLRVAGWTPTTPTVIRTLVDILVSVFAVARKPEDSEYMGFRYLTHSLIEGIHDPDTLAAVVKHDSEQVNKLKAILSAADTQRADDLILRYKQKTPPLWYWPEFPNPGTAIKQNMGRLWTLWHTFCGATHGADIGSLLFSDRPDDVGINPEGNPRKTRIATVISSRFLLDISHARAQFEGVADDPEYKRIITIYIQPQQRKIET
jgi:hypothetical protein